MPIYATASDLADYSPSLVQPDDVDGYLRAAGRLVGWATRVAVYPVTVAGVPTDTGLAGVMRDAVCEQVTAWTRAGVDPVVGDLTGADDRVTSRTTTAGPRTVTEQYEKGSPAAVVPVDGLTPAAWSILAMGGLTGANPVGVRGGYW
jgi:hypothetical protein